MHALFSARRDLFQGLWIDLHGDWKWTQHPIIHLSLSTIYNRSTDKFELDLIDTLQKIGKKHGISTHGISAARHLESLIEQLAVKQKVVVLIDEYDKPLIDRLDDLDVAIGNREILREFYSILKDLDRYLEFIFLTGVTRFAKVSIFLGLNNLIDLTMLDQCSALLGYTEEELVTHFSQEIEEIAAQNRWTKEQCYAHIKEWYNGYLFSNSGQRVHNPFSVLNLLNAKTFNPYWFETGTPLFLINLIKKRHFDLSNLEQINVNAHSFSSFDIEELPTLPLLYQTGYLTVKSYLESLNAYSLGFPNREVSQAFSESLLTAFAESKAECSKSLVELSANLIASPWDYERFFAIMNQILALIPYDLYVKQEKYFHSLVYLSIKLAGFQIGAEIHTWQGRTDAVLEAKDKVIVFEFKFNKDARLALDQIWQRQYFLSYQERKQPIYLVGINFNAGLHAIDDWLVEQMPC